MICENLGELKNRVAIAAKRSARNPQDITTVAVTKTATVEMIKQAIDCGIKDIGENRVQDALEKFSALRHTPYAIRIKWHLVGHLQTNKAKDAVEIFDLIHSVDSLRIANEINKQAAKINKVQDILLEVNTSGETTKFGLKPEEVVEVLKKIANLKNISIKGLMTIAPIVDNPEKARPYFRKLRELRDEINRLSSIVPALPAGRHRPSFLSMGMTDDFEVAIEEGATMIRIGRAIFERG